MALEASREDAEDETVAYARAKLRMSLTGYENLLSRIAAARIDLGTVRGAFKYRYTVVKPVAVPEEPARLRAASTLGGGALAGVLLAIAVGILLDAGRGRIVEGWQLPRRFGLPVLAEVAER
jgi:hypothetical protein